MEDDTLYNKKSLEELHNRINKILAQLPELTGRADNYSRAVVATKMEKKEDCDSDGSISVDGVRQHQTLGGESRKASALKIRMEAKQELLNSSHREGIAKEAQSGRRGRIKMYRKRQRSFRKWSGTEVNKNQPEMTLSSDTGSETCVRLSTETVSNDHCGTVQPVECLAGSLSQSLRKLQKLNFDIPNLDTPDMSAEPYKKSDNLACCKQVEKTNDESEESLDESDAYLPKSTTAKLERDVKSSRESQNNSRKKISGLSERSIDEDKPLGPPPNEHSFILNAHEDSGSAAADENFLRDKPNCRDASSERAAARLNQSLDKSMPKEVKDNGPQALFTYFIASTELKEILFNFRLLCKSLKVQTSFCRSRTFRLIQSNLNNAELWPKLWKSLNEKTKMAVYSKQSICMNTNVLIVGAGPCGLRAAIECALLGARVVLTEKRPDFSRTNCVYLWSFVIEDLISLGANSVGGRFSTCRSSESADNVYPIATIQLVLTKLALLLGVTIVTSCEFLDILYPSSELDSYRILFKAYKHSRFSTFEDFKLHNYHFKTLICASGQSIALPELFCEKANAKKSNTAGFGITANFVKRAKEQDRSVKQEAKIGGALKRSNSTLLGSTSNRDDLQTNRPPVSCRSSSKVNHSLRAELSKDEIGQDIGGGDVSVCLKQSTSTNQKGGGGGSSSGYTHNFKMAIEKGFFHQTVMHYDLDKLYFIMTVNASVLKSCGAIKQNFEDNRNKTMSTDNINPEAMAGYITAAANYATHGRYFPLEFALNKKGEADFSLFYSSPNVTANHAGKLIERFGHKLLVILVGDSLIHPFWKTGSGLAKGFMSVLDAAWVLKTWSEDVPGDKPLSVLALQESLYLFLKDLKSSAIKSYDMYFCMDPCSRYKSLASLPIVKLDSVRSLLDADQMDGKPVTDEGYSDRVLLPQLQQSRQHFKCGRTQNFSILNLLKKLKPIEQT